jgi:sugar lactone lactonase YvrE
MKPPSSVPEIVADKSCRLAGTPFWGAASGLLYWADAHDGRLWTYEPAAGKSGPLSVEQNALACAPRDDGSAVVVLADGTLRLLRAPNILEPIAGRLPWGPEARLDAAAMDGQGRLWCAVGRAAARAGSLCRVNADGEAEEVAVARGPISGLGFDGSGNLYCCDAVSREVLLFSSPGDVRADRRVIVQIPESLGIPHGLAMDARGWLWVAIWGGSCILRISPTGKEDQRHYFTARLISGLAFGGADLRDLYVVTSGAEDRKANGPGAGALYRLRPGVKGASVRPAP